MKKLTNKNYFDMDMNMKYCSSSQFKDFFGTMMNDNGCEARALARLKGEYEEETSKAMLIGAYIDSYFEGSLDLFKSEHPELFKKNGELKSDFIKAEEIIEFIKKDKLFMKYMDGEKQVIMTGVIEGVDFKIKIDSYHRNKAIIDLKVMSSITKGEYVKSEGKVSFIDYWGYDIQSAIYQEIVRQNINQKLPFFIAATTKEKVPNKEVLFIDDERLDECLNYVKSYMPRLKQLKAGEVEPIRCEKCDYCRSTKILKEPKHYKSIDLD